MDLPNSGIPSASWVSPPIVNMKGHSLYSTTGTTQLCTQMAKLIYISAPLFYNFPQSTFTQKTAFPIHNVSVDLRGTDQSLAWTSSKAKPPQLSGLAAHSTTHPKQHTLAGLFQGKPSDTAPGLPPKPFTQTKPLLLPPRFPFLPPPLNSQTSRGVPAKRREWKRGGTQ